MKNAQKLLIVLILGTSFIACTPEALEQNYNDNVEVLSTGDDDDIGPDNKKDG